MEFWESFWGLIGWFLWATIFIAYLMSLFSILGDIVRDGSLPGWGKAIWVVLLIFVPFLTALVYLIARGDGMAERSVKAIQANQDAANEYIRSVAAETDPTAQIERAAKLLADGTISQEEFDRLKANALAS